MNIAGLDAAAVRIEPITSTTAYSTIIRRWGKCWANWTASTVPIAYPALARPEPRVIVCRLMWSWRAMIGVNGWSAADKARNGTSANTTIAAAGA